MSSKQLTTRQKQQIIVSILGLIVGFIILQMAVLGPMKKKLAEAKTTIGDLQVKVNRANDMVPKLPQFVTAISKRGEELQEQSDAYLPLPGNEFAWAAGLVYSVGRQTDQGELEVKDIGRTIRDVRQTAPMNHNPFLQAYTVKVTTSCSFDKLKDFLEALEDKNPYLTVASLRISESTEDMENHRVEMNLQWPVWADSQFLKNLISKP